MKYLFLFLPILGYGQITIETSPYVDFYSYKSYFNYPAIVFSTSTEEVKFTPGRLVYMDSLSNTKVLECDSSVFKVLSTVNEQVFKMQSEQLRQLQLKVLWYEKHFGKLEGDMNDECIEFNPTNNPPNIQPCKK